MPSMRESVNPAALVNWYRLLWHERTTENSMNLSENIDLARLERDLFALLHYKRRDDLSIMVCVMRVWALARTCIVRDMGEFGDVSSFSDIERMALPRFDANRTLRHLENKIAFLCGAPVDAILIPPIYRQSPPLGMPGFELTDEGVLILFSLWHGHLLDLFSRVGDVVLADPVPCLPSVPSYSLGDDDYRLLDRILGMENVPLQAIFSFYSNPNPFTLIKHSGADFTNQTKMAGTLFDHEPMLYKESTIGRLLLLARGYKVPFFVNDEILFHCRGGDRITDRKIAFWLFYSLERKFAALVIDDHVAVLFDFGVDAEILLDRLHAVLSAKLGPPSTDPEGAMEEEI